LKTHYAGEAERLQRDTVTKQDTIDKTDLRAVFTSDEALYALSHLSAIGPPLDREKLRSAREATKQLPQDAAAVVNEALQRYELSRELVEISRNVITEFQITLRAQVR
jgi:hypothetical protein